MDVLNPTAASPPDPPGFPLQVSERVQAAWRVLHHALSNIGIDSSDAQVIRPMSEDVVFRVGNLAAKVYPPDADAASLDLRLSVLGQVAGGPWVPPAFQQTFRTSDGFVTFWPWCDTATSPDWADMGALLLRFRETEVPGVELLPVWSPLKRVESQMERYAACAGFDPSVIEIVLRARLHLLEQVPEIDSELGYGLIHGDVHPGNTAQWQGELAFIDLDTVGYGPREYDLVGAALRLAKGEIDVATYMRFSDAVGYDVRDWTSLPLVEDICTLGAATFSLGEQGPDALAVPSVREVLGGWERRLSK